MTIESLSKGNNIAKKADKIDSCLELFKSRFDEAFKEFIAIAEIQDISDDALKNEVFDTVIAYYYTQKAALKKEFESL